MSDSRKRPGEIALDFDPAETAEDGSVVFIGRIESAWKTRDECPKNIARARERGVPAMVAIDEAWRQGLTGLEAGARIVVMYWMHEAPRNLIIQAPRHRPDPVGVFALRSPARPNPIALASVTVLDIDQDAGRLTIDAIDCLDGTPVIDIKPWIASIDGQIEQDSSGAE